MVTSKIEVTTFYSFPLSVGFKHTYYKPSYYSAFIVYGEYYEI